MKPEPCEFTSAELIQLARGMILSVQQLASYHEDCLIDEQLQNAEKALGQALAQLEYNNGAATPFPEDKDPWAWEDPDTFCPSA